MCIRLIMERIEIPKDCLLCDICNKQLSNEKFVALEDQIWYAGQLTCESCDQKYECGKSYEVIRFIKKGEDLSKTDLALPIVMEFG